MLLEQIFFRVCIRLQMAYCGFCFARVCVRVCVCVCACVRVVVGVIEVTWQGSCLWRSCLLRLWLCLCLRLRLLWFLRIMILLMVLLLVVGVGVFIVVVLMACGGRLTLVIADGGDVLVHLVVPV